MSRCLPTVGSPRRLQVPTIGDIPTGIPAVQIGSIPSVSPDQFPTIIGFGVSLALFGSIAIWERVTSRRSDVFEVDASGLHDL